MTASLTAAVVLSMPGAADSIEFNRDVRPILSNHCFTCHGPDAASRESGLRLDQRPAAIRAADSGLPAIIPGNAEESQLIIRVRAEDPAERMPPAHTKAYLNADQITTLAEWIDQGAEYETHWAFTPVSRVEVPLAGNSDWPRNTIDQFVLDKLNQHGLQPAPEATRETLIRRVAFDLTGLPPDIPEIDAFLQDTSRDAYERMVERYLAKPEYGEHMARHWLDLARYADTNGYQYDTERTQWVWRDYVIDAYNRNMRFDDFTIQQLAGDLLPDATPQTRLATGFHRNHGITIEGGIIDEEYRTEYVMDRLVTTGNVWLGMTVGCARCHDHKYDPISQNEFYQLYAFFNQVPERGMNGFAPQETIPSPLGDRRQQQLDAELAKLRLLLKAPVDVPAELRRWTQSLSHAGNSGWQILHPISAVSSGGSTLTPLDDGSLLAGDANPRQDIYEITARTQAANFTAIRLEALTHDSLPGGGPGRHSNSNFVLSEFEVTVRSLADPSQSQQLQFSKAIADYSQANYEIAKAIDGTTANNNGWAVDGPTRKQNATALFVAKESFGYEGGTELQFRLRHEAGFATHGIGRPRLSVTTDPVDSLSFEGVPTEIRQIAATPASDRSHEQTNVLQDYFLAHHHPHQNIHKRIAALNQQMSEAYPKTMIMQDMKKWRPTHVLNRGQYNEPLEKVQANVPAIFPPLPDGEPASRLELARWLVSADHPLTARVAVNRYWQRLFGTGLVKTSEDFGLQGELPSHPELLDWLAGEFIHSGWDIKHIHRLILTSATYRQSSHVGSAAYQRDPENRLLARGPRLRLDAEEVRDAALFCSGLLVNRLGGPSVYPYQPKGLWLELNNRPGYSKEYPQGSGEDLYRRSIYTFWKRTVPSPMLKTFDAPEREFCTVRRSRTNTPLQALVSLNGIQFVEAARNLAQRMLREGGRSTADQITFGFRTVTARPPRSEELSILVESYHAEVKRFSADPKDARALLQIGDSKHDGELDEFQLAAMTSVARLLFNLNEAITRG